jgi:hypothetical protein
MSDSKIGNIDFVDTKNGPTAKSSSSPFSESLYFSDSFDEASITAFIKSVERMIRTSHEYSQYLGLLKTNYDTMNHDDILSNISNADATIEFHHYPFSLYDIIDTVVSYHLTHDDKFTSYSIADEVMREHFANRIGLVPLTKTNHELAHDGHLFISKTQVFGDYKAFMNKYKDGVSAELIKKIADMEKQSDDGRMTDEGGILNV